MKPKDVSEISFDSRINRPDAQRVSLAKFGRHGNDAPKVVHPQSLGKERTMTIQHPGMSRRTLLSTITLGVPALGLLGAANLIGAPAAQAKSGSLVVDGWWGPATTRRLQLGFGLPTSGVVEAQSAGWAKQNTALSSGWRWVPNSRARGSAVIRGVQVMLGIPGWSDRPQNHPRHAGQVRAAPGRGPRRPLPHHQAFPGRTQQSRRW